MSEQNEQPVLKMEESSFLARSQKNRPIKIVKQVWENNCLMIYFYYVKE